MDYSKLLSKTAMEIKPSGIRKFFDLIFDMKDAISLTIGEPGFSTPAHIADSGVKSISEGKTYYTSNSGLVELRTAISKYFSENFGTAYEPSDEVVLTVGGSEAVDIAVRTIVEPGDEVIIPMPSYVCYEPVARLAGGKPVIIETKEENKFKITPDELRAAISPRTKLLILPYPSNPTGAIMTKGELSAIADVLRGTDILVLSDEIYGELTYGRHHCSFSSIDGMRERTVVASGFSKAFAMTGWRLGYLLAPREISKHMLKIHQFVIMCAPTAAQYTALEALRDGRRDVEFMKNEYDSRRKYMLRRFEEMGLPCFEPEGAFYTFPNISKFGMTSEVFCEKMLYANKVAIVPGTAFGDCGEGFARISYSYSMEHIKEGLNRMEAFIKALG